MRLKSLEYAQHKGEPEEWTLHGLTLRDVNLLVGKNASGKSRILNVIHNLARGISDRHTLLDGHFRTVFEHNGSEVAYELEVRHGIVVRETFRIDGDTKLDRGLGGKGTILAVREKKRIEFQTPENRLAVHARRDSIQHPFFEDLHSWAGSLYHYAFGTPLGQERLHMSFNGESEPNGETRIDPRDSSQVVLIFRKGREDFSDEFLGAVREDFGAIGYSIDEVGIGTPRGYRGLTPAIGEVAGIYVKETDLPGITDQTDMSQGMFRALSVIVQVNYSVLAGAPSCILIDDIGEGLDFDRSCNLIDVLIRKAENSSVQLIMATNDRFVMNRVPLEAWSVVDRKGNHVEIRDYENSREIFDNFRFTGLNNFDFLAFDYLHAGVTDE